MQRRLYVVSVLIFLCLTGCANLRLDRFAPETVELAKSEFDYLRQQRFDKIRPSLDPRIDTATIDQRLSDMAILIPHDEPLSVKTVGAWVQCSTNNGCVRQVSLEYEFPQEWILLQFSVHEKNGKTTITQFFVLPKAESLEKTNRFTLFGKGLVQYIFLLGFLGVIAFTVYALRACIRTPMERKKWLWIVAILLGCGQMSVNWTLGTVYYRFFYISILPVGIGGGLYEPWIISIAIPIGAIAFLMNRRRYTKPETNDMTLLGPPPANTTV